MFTDDPYEIIVEINQFLKSYPICIKASDNYLIWDLDIKSAIELHQKLGLALEEYKNENCN